MTGQRAVHAPSSATRCCATSTARRCTRARATPIWFDEAAEQIGADVMRWMFSATNPAVNLNFGYRPGPRGGAPLLPAAVEHLRLLRHLRPPRRLDAETAGPMAWPQRGRMLDRWILSRLDGVIGEVRAALDAYDAMRAARAIEAFVDELSNWYVRRNRRRFWKGELDARQARRLRHPAPRCWSRPDAAARAVRAAPGRGDVGEPGDAGRPGERAGHVHLPTSRSVREGVRGRGARGRRWPWRDEIGGAGSHGPRGVRSPDAPAAERPHG